MTVDELKEGVNLIKDCNLTNDDIDQAMGIMDSNKNGYIDYTEFIAACLQSYNYLKENHLKSAFSYFDKDNSGTISLDELKQCLQSEDFTLPEDLIAKLLKEADFNNDNQVRTNFFNHMFLMDSD